MKNKKLLIISSMFILGSVLSVGGCGKEKQKASEVKPKAVTTAAPTAAPTAVPEPTATPVPAKILGTKTDGAYEVQLKNATTRPIRAMAIKSDGEADFITQLMTEGDIFAPDEERMLYYKPAAAPEATAAGASYDIRITFGDDGSTVTLHAFPFGSMKKGDLLAADGVGYLNYEGIVDTKEAELAIVAQQVAEAQAAAARAAEAQAVAESTEQYSSSEGSYNENYDENYNNDSSYDDGSYDNSYDNGVTE